VEKSEAEGGAALDQAPPVVVEELGHLARVRRALAEQPEAAAASETLLVGEIVQLQNEMLTARAEDRSAIHQHLEHMQARLDQIRRGRGGEPVDPDSPYFGHLGLLENGRPNHIFIGRATRVAEGLRIVDWRNAPVSRMFYRYEEGEEFEEELAGRFREGTIIARRTLHIDRGELLRVGTSTGSWLREERGWRELSTESQRLAGGQGAALRAGRAHESSLGAARGGLRADKHLPDIAALIDPEQFALITGSDSGVVVLRGSAGSGKTTVALHRIAWLNYQDPRRFAPERMLVVVWGRGMRDYVGHVLPALGVPGVTVTTWDEWSRRLVLRTFGNQLPHLWADDTPEPVVRIKLHPGVAELLAAHIRTTPGKPRPLQAIEDWATILTDRAAIAAAMGTDISEAALDRAMRWLLDQTRAVVSFANGRSDADARLDDEDAALLLRAAQLRLGPLKDKNGKALAHAHIALDEVQDFSPIEVQVLLDTADKHRCVTLAGDVRQHISEAAGFSSWTEFLERIGVPSTSLATLEISYRSTHPITAFAVSVLGDHGEPPPRTTRDGPAVELFPFTDLGATIAFLAQELRGLLMREPLANVAILTPNAEISRLCFDGLRRAEVNNLRLVVDQDFAFAPGIDVVEAGEVKGLEFDYVVVVEVSAKYWPDSAHHRRLLHVAATRAVHQLWLTCTGTLSPILPEAVRG